MATRLKYFSVAVTDIHAAIKLYQELLGLKQMTEIKETHWGFRNTMMGDGQQAFLELIEPVDPKSALARFMKERSGLSNPPGEGVYIIGLEVDDLRSALERVRGKGGKVTQEPQTPNAAWVHPLSLRHVLIELSQAKK
jgi:predicted enzyme related to lactoylglutathione lyase